MDDNHSIQGTHRMGEISNNITAVFRIMQDTLQTELGILEQIYLRINLKVEFGAQNWTTALMKSSQCVLKRMEIVLKDLGFPESHQDRLLIAELLANSKKKRKMA